MSGEYNLPWFPAWGIEFENPIENLNEIISRFNQIRPNNRWSLVSFDSVASEFHLWSTWMSVVSNELKNAMIAKSVDVEFLRLLSGNRQISKAFEITGLAQGDKNAWIISIPKKTAEVNHEFGLISKNIYLDLEDDANKLIQKLGSSLLPKRPTPNQSGLIKLGIELNDLNLTLGEKEDLFIGSMALTDI